MELRCSDFQFSAFLFIFLSLLTFCVKGWQDSCGYGFTEYEGACYSRAPFMGNWQTHRDDCRRNQADLVSIHDLDLNNFLHEEFVPDAMHGKLWIGFNCYDGTGGCTGDYEWSDGHNVTFTNWNPDSPPQGQYGCTVLTTDGYWEEEHCSNNHGGICAYKIELDTETSTAETLPYTRELISTGKTTSSLPYSWSTVHEVVPTESSPGLSPTDSLTVPTESSTGLLPTDSLTFPTDGWTTAGGSAKTSAIPTQDRTSGGLGESSTVIFVTTDEGGGDSGLSSGEIVGIVFGVGVFLIVMSGVCIVLCRWRKDDVKHEKIKLTAV